MHAKTSQGAARRPVIFQFRMIVNQPPAPVFPAKKSVKPPVHDQVGLDRGASPGRYIFHKVDTMAMPINRAPPHQFETR